ncbi:hypothetical protein [Aliagarivorans taiwanensis]|uniref:hypothetical protein n=1 Tax=Aliagarivorans taiwanensis TaxID=561966 RepID=UPI0004209759|nr:hypothetical protein [Aliagarivorans taiwanensis]
MFFMSDKEYRSLVVGQSRVIVEMPTYQGVVQLRGDYKVHLEIMGAQGRQSVELLFSMAADPMGGSGGVCQLIDLIGPKYGKPFNRQGLGSLALGVGIKVMQEQVLAWAGSLDGWLVKGQLSTVGDDSTSDPEAAGLARMVFWRKAGFTLCEPGSPSSVIRASLAELSYCAKPRLESSDYANWAGYQIVERFEPLESVIEMESASGVEAGSLPGYSASARAQADQRGHRIYKSCRLGMWLVASVVFLWLFMRFMRGQVSFSYLLGCTIATCAFAEVGAVWLAAQLSV